jgi:hypothetical protein
MKRPASLKIVAFLFIVSGFASAWDGSSGLSHGRINLDFGILALFVGIGLLGFKRGWRTCALGMVWLSFLFTALALGKLIILPESVMIRWGDLHSTAAQRPIMVWVLVTAFNLLVAWVYWVLTHRDVRRLFGIQEA